MSTTSTALMTAEELTNLPDDNLRHEPINGKLIAMPLHGLLHGRIVARISAQLGPLVWDHDLGEVYSVTGYQLTWSPDTVLGPDLSFISKQRLKEVGEVEGYWQGPPDLAVEVVGPDDWPDKVNKKISRWLESGTKQVWIVDSRYGTVTIYRSELDTTTFSGSDYLEAQDLFPGLRIALHRIFGE